MKLTSDIVETLITQCLLRPDESRSGAIEVEGIVGDYSFHPDRIRANADLIAELLAELPAGFHASGGGGRPLREACNDRFRAQWTNLNRRVEELVCLGIAAGKARWMMKDLSEVLPARMPYFVVV